MNLTKLLSLAAALAICVISNTVGAEPAGNAETFPLPYLQNPAADAMTVCFLTRDSAKVREASVAWGADGAWFLKTTPAKGAEIAGTSWTVWKVRLTYLKAGKVYQYQVRYQEAAGKSVTPIYHFRTLDPQAKTFHAIAFNDTHNGGGVVSNSLAFLKPEDFECSVLLGDILEGKAEAVIASWNTYVRLLDGANKPIMFVRGNHDTRGEFAKRLANLFDLPNLDAAAPWGEDQWQYTFRAGPVSFLALDGGEDDDDRTNVDSYKNPNLWQKVRRRQAEWLKTILAAKTGQEAPWRIYLSHIPLYNSPWTSARARQLWAPLITEWKPDLALAGHDHTWRMPAAGGAAWPTLVGGGPGPGVGCNEPGTVMVISADATTLQVRLLASKDGKQLAEFKAHRDGAQVIQ